MGEFAGELNEVLRSEWESGGFRHIRGLRWVEQTSGPLRRIFEFQAVGSGAHTRSARWGFSLDFVPAFRTRRFRWKRTPKSADFDLCIDPIDSEGSATQLYSLTHVPGFDEPLGLNQVSRVVSQASEAARHDFARVGSVSDLVRLFDERARMSFKRFSLENYIQTHRAWGLALVALGNQVEGQSHVREFCQRFQVDWGDPFLLKAEAEALRHAQMSLQ